MRGKVWVPALAVGLALLPRPGAAAANAALVADINSGTPPAVSPEGGPSQLTVVGGRVVFLSQELSSGAELWVTDGTPQGTELLRDICPGSCPSSPRLLGTAGGVAFLFAQGSSSAEVWRTDGTRAGTIRLATPQGFYPQTAFAEFALTAHALFFSACGAGGDCEPWTSDGTVAGTRQIADLYPGGASSYPFEFRVLGERAYFIASTAPGSGLWRTDGTAAGTSLVHANVAVQGLTAHLTSTGNRLFFVAPGDGVELWTSDGTPEGTRALTSFTAANPQFGAFEAFGDLLYFVVDDVTGGYDLWQSDGTVAGTHRVTDFGYAFPFSGEFGPANMERVGDHLLFVASDGLTGDRLWTSDGTPASTKLLPGCDERCSTPGDLHDLRLWPLGQRVVWFSYDDSGMSLWSSDGTAAGTHKVRDLCGGSCGPDNENVSIAGGRLYFVTDAFSSPARYQLWQSDGTTAGTRVLSETSHPSFFGDAAGLHVVAGPPGDLFAVSDVDGNELWKIAGASIEPIYRFYVGEASSDPTGLQAFGDQLLFGACDGSERALWLSGGSAATTRALPGPWYGCSGDLPPQGATVVGGLAFFVQERFEDPYDWQLWRTDGSSAGTIHLASFGFEPSNVGSLVAYAGKLVFAVTYSDHVELWTSDGTGAGTRLLVDLGTGVREVSALTSTGPDLYFAGSPAQYGADAEVWRSDGTVAGTRTVTDFTDSNPFRAVSPRFTRLGDTVYFLAQGSLWRSQGTLASTTVVPPPAAGSGSGVQALTAFQGSLYFFAYSGQSLHRGLWRSNGTTAGTTLLAEGAPVRYFTVDEIELVAGDTALYYKADDGEHGEELWVSDGTAAGTHMVRDVLPGETSSAPSELTAVGGRLFFSASDGQHGFELWESDGTAAGTRMVQDVAPGALSSSPRELAAAGASLFFSADDGAWGRELWSLPLAGTACEPTPYALCLGGGRYKVEGRWADFSGNRGAAHAVALTADTGYFWFFDAANVEVVLKVLDGRVVNDHVWVFYGALSSVEYTLTVTDTATGAARRYQNPSSRLGSVADTSAFGPLGATPSTITIGPAATAASTGASAVRRQSSTTAVPCIPSATRLCLNGGRFAVEARWTVAGGSGVGQAVRLTGDTGYLWFFGADNVELIVKVLDGRAVNGKFWVFFGALSDVDYTVTVTDTATGAVREYHNPQGRVASVADTSAF